VNRVLRKKRVFLAGPIIGGNMMDNVRQAIDAADALRHAGHFPFIPHLAVLWRLVHARDDRAWWLEWGMEWLRACDALVRLPGASPGADEEVAQARAWGIPVWEGMAAFFADEHKHEALWEHRLGSVPEDGA
jgi:hypothetical protein